MSNDHVALSRRGFLKGTLATAGVALAGASHAGDIPAEWAKPKCSNWSWEKPMEKIPADQIKKTVDTDVVVIGAGLAGFSAALSAAEEGAKVVVVEKTRSWSARGGHITAFGSKVQKSMKVNVDVAEIVRRLIAWGQGRMDERLLWMFAKKCGACMDWAVDLAAKNDVKVTLWEGYYKGPTYTEFPVTHFFYNKDVSLDYTYGNSTGIGNVVLMPCFEKELKAKGVNIMYRTPAVQLIREKNNGRVTGLIVGRRGNYTRINAKKGVIIATGCYASNMEMRKCYSPYSLRVDAQIYYPTKSNTGDGHIMAMQIGGVMQKNDNHAATVHLEAGAASYGFLHVNGQGNRFSPSPAVRNFRITVSPGRSMTPNGSVKLRSRSTATWAAACSTARCGNPGAPAGTWTSKKPRRLSTLRTARLLSPIRSMNLPRRWEFRPTT